MANIFIATLFGLLIFCINKVCGLDVCRRTSLKTYYCIDGYQCCNANKQCYRDEHTKVDLHDITVPKMNWESSDLLKAWNKFEQLTKLFFEGPMKGKSDKEKTSYFLLWVGEKGRDIIQNWAIHVEDIEKPDVLYDMLRVHVLMKLNPMYARFMFNSIKQGTDSIESFVIKLRFAATYCRFKDLHVDEMLRDRIVCGTSSGKLRDRLINEGESLTLDEAVKIAQSSEYSREQPDYSREKPDYSRKKPKSEQQELTTESLIFWGLFFGSIVCCCLRKNDA